MLSPDPGIEITFLTEGLPFGTVLLAYAARLCGIAMLLPAIVVLTAVVPLQALAEFETLVESGDDEFESEWRRSHQYFGDYSSGPVYVAGHGPANGQFIQPVSANHTSWLDGFGIAPRLAFRDDLYVLPFPPPFLAAQNSAANGSQALPGFPPPTNPTPAPAREVPGPTQGNGDPIRYEVENETESSKDDISQTGPTGEDLELPDEDENEGAKPEGPEEKIPDLADFARALLPLRSGDDKITFTPGLRIQPRFNYDDNFNNNDFFINRFRLKGAGNAYDIAKYGVELKIDGTSRFEASPSAQVENAWLDFKVLEDYAYLRAGLYDLPFSRNALTSDSKLLLMDRSLIKDALTALGMADNTVGLMLHGRPCCGHVEYDFGIFDNVVFEKIGPAGTRGTDQLMPAGRIAFALLDPAENLDSYADYKGSYIGKGERLDIGFNGAHLGNVIDGVAEFDLSALGTDLFFNMGPYTFQTEFDWFIEDIGGAADLDGSGWYVQGGYLFNHCDPCVEFATRYQVLDSDIVGDTLRWTSVGFNFYIRDHNLKVQTDYTFRDGGALDDDVFEVQLQLDF